MSPHFQLGVFIAYHNIIKKLKGSMTVPMHQEYLPKLIKVLPEILGIDKIAVFVSKDNQLELKIINGSLNKKIMYKCEDEHHPVHK